MNKSLTVFLAVALVFSLGMGGFPSVYAQEADVDEFTLEEVTVTAEKRQVNVQDIAASVTAITGANIRDRAINNIDSVLTNMAGVVLNLTTPSGSGIYIRGVGTNVDTGVADASVQINLDGVYVGRAEIGFNSMFDIDRVEVLRGPQGTLYGRNAIGGTLNVITQRPSDEFEAEAHLRLGNYNLQHIQAAVNIPISEQVSARIALMNEERSSYFKPEGDSSDKFSTRARILYEPNDDLSILFTAEWIYDRSLGRPQVPIPGSAGKLTTPGPPVAPPSFTKPDENRDGQADDFLVADPVSGELVPGPIGPDGWPVGDGILDLVQTGWLLPTGADAWTNDEWHKDAPNFDYRWKLYSLEIVWDLPYTRMTLFPAINDNQRAYSIRNVMFGESREKWWDYAGYSVDTPIAEDQWSYEIRFQNLEDSAIKWLVGHYAMESDNKSIEEPRDPTTYGDDEWHFVSYVQPTKTTAFFGQVTYPVTERFRVTGGLRHSTDSRNRQYRYANAQLPVGHPLAPAGGVYDSGKLTYSDELTNTTYKAGIEFDFNADSMIYAQLTTGFKQGGLNMIIPPDTFDSEELTSYSIGTKNRFLNNRLQLNAEAFYYDYVNFQLQVPIRYTHSISGETLDYFQYVDNADDAVIMGLEVEMDWLVTPFDHVSFTGTYTDSEYGHTVLPFNPMAGTPETDLVGTQMANTPKWTFTLGWEHTWEMQDGDAVSARAFTRVSDSYHATVEKNLAGVFQDRYHISELNMYYRPAGGKWSAGVWVKNLENQAVILRALPIYRKFITEPRTAGINFDIRF